MTSAAAAPTRSTSSPEAEEYNSRVFAAVLKTTRAAAKLAAQDLAYIQTTTNPTITDTIDRLASRLVGITNSLLVASGAGEVGSVSELEEQWGEIADVNDRLFEKTDTYLDLFLSGKDSNAAQPVPVTVAAASNVNLKRKNWYQMNEEMLKTNIEPPQKKFKQPPDNYDTTPFKPLLTKKPHARLSLEDSLQIIQSKDSDMLIYDNPYAYEIENSKFPKFMKKPAKPVDAMPLETTSPIWVDNLKLLKAMLRDLKSEREIAVDLEHHEVLSYRGFVCLMQISTRSQDYLIDTLVLRSELEVLNEVFTNPQIVKVFHGAKSDVIWLQRDFGLYVVGMFDTYHAAKVLELEGKSLAYLLDMFCSFQADKQYQLADWRIRPLTQQMIEYARCDTHFLLVLYDKLRNKLLASGEDKLEIVLASSRKECRQVYIRHVYDAEKGSGPFGWAALAQKWSLADELLPMLKAITQWRDDMAKRADTSLNYVLPNKAVFALLKLKPADVPGLMAAIGKSISHVVKENATELLKIIRENDSLLPRAESAKELPVTAIEAQENKEKAELEALKEQENGEISKKRIALAREIFPGKPVNLAEAEKSSFWGDILDK